MTIQDSVTVRNAMADSRETTVGTSPILQLRTGSPPADCATADSGTLLVAMNLPSDWLTAAAAGLKSKAGTWSGTGAAAGTVGHFRIKNTAGSVTHQQGTAGAAVPLTTSAATAANGNVLTFTATTGVAVGMNVSGTGIVAGTTVAAFTGTTVTLSQTSTAGVAISTAITFAPDMVLDNAVIAVSQTVSVGTFDLTRSNA
jgi:hypothetical protein